MKQKPKAHSRILFTSYLETDEHLIWVSEAHGTGIKHIYYAITTKRLLILCRYFLFWNRLRTSSLILLPEFRLHRDDDKSASLHFSPYRINRHDRQGKVIDYSQAIQANIENLNHNAAQIAYELLSAAKEERLEARARELGLME